MGADGVHSEVRKHIINDGNPLFKGYNIWRAVVETTFEIGFTSETFANGQRVVILPIKDGVYGWWATCNEAYMHDDMPLANQTVVCDTGGRMRCGGMRCDAGVCDAGVCDKGVCYTPLPTVRAKRFRPG